MIIFESLSVASQPHAMRAASSKAAQIRHEHSDPLHSMGLTFVRSALNVTISLKSEFVRTTSVSTESLSKVFCISGEF